MAPLDLTKPELTPQDREDIRNEVERFEVLYQERYGALSALQRANLTRAHQNLVEFGIGLGCPADALMAWGVHTGLTNDMLEDWLVIERLILAYDGVHKDLDAYIRELYFHYFDISDKQALRFIDTVSFKGELEYQGYCFAPSLDGTAYHVFND
jgi:hypothetical protein